MPYQYNPQGALNGLFAPAYIPGNPESVAATTGWNAARAPMTTPGTTPGAPPPAGPPPATFNPVVGNSALQAAMSRLPPNVQARFGSRFGMQPAAAPAAAGGSFTFTEPTLPSAAAPVDARRNTIAQTLMNRPPAAQPSPNPLVNAGQSFFNQVAAPFQNFASAATRLAMPNLASQPAAPSQTPMKRPGYGV
jgi:hypothetical protein